MCSTVHAAPTVDVVLLLRGHDGHQVSSLHAAVLLGHLPALTLAEVSIAKTTKLVPARVTSLQVCVHHRTRVNQLDWQASLISLIRNITIKVSLSLMINFKKQFIEACSSFVVSKAHRSDRRLLRMLANRDTWSVHPARCRCLHSDRGHPDRHLKHNRSLLNPRLLPEALLDISI